MQLTAHDLSILHLAARDIEGRLSFYIAEDGSIALLGKGVARPLFAEDSLPKLEELGLVSRDVSRTYVLTPEGWEALIQAEGGR
jgi:hypothetical protein